MTPILAVVGLLSFVAVIGEFVMASMFLTDGEQEDPRHRALRLVAVTRSNNLGVFCAGRAAHRHPRDPLFMFLQRYIVGGLTAGCVKG